MLGKKVLQLVNTQYNLELQSSYLYLAMSAFCDRKGLKGFANWLRIQAQEELIHGMHMYDYILERGNDPEFADIAVIPGKYTTVVQVFEQTLAHEQVVTKNINAIATAAMGENDHASYGFIQWYVNEQVEEESSADLILQKLKLIGENTGLLFALDAELATRTFVNPFPAAAT